MATINGTNSDNDSTGGASADTIRAGAGDDSYAGLGGNDSIDASLGDDTIEGSANDDSIQGGVGNDVLLGGTGNDSLTGDDVVFQDGHYYAFVRSPVGVRLIDARKLAEGVSSDSQLVTISTAEENELVVSLVPTGLFAWTAGVQLPGFEGEEGWVWFNRNGPIEFFEFTDWSTAPEQPDDARPGLALIIRSDIGPAQGGGGNWGDTAATDQALGYLIEAETLPDLNDFLDGGDGNDRADGSLGKDTVWGGNGNDTLGGGEGDDRLVGDAWQEFEGRYYAYVRSDGTLTQGTARTAAEALTPDSTLVAINSQAENDFVFSLLPPAGFTWTGGVQPGGSSEPGGGWVWQGRNGVQTPLTFTDWQANEPNNAGGAENAIELFNSGALGWNDIPAGNSTRVDGYVVEALTLPAGLALNDVLDGGQGNDTVAAGFGDDTAGGGEGDDSVAGEAGADRVLGANGDDTVDGGAGDDVVGGQAGDDSASGGDGDDVLEGNAGSDTMAGGAGADRLTGDDPAGAWVDFGGHSYRLVSGAFGYDASRLIAESQTIDSSMAAIGSAAENDFLAGLVPGGTAVHVGGVQPPGSAEPAGGWVWRMRDGDVALTFTNWLSPSEPNNFGGAENVILFLDTGFWNDVAGATPRNGVIVEAPTPVLAGDGGADSLDGGEGDDTFEGGAGADTLIGGEGKDELDGGTGADSMAGGAGNDLFLVDAAGDVVFELQGEGNDTVSASVGWILGAQFEGLELQGAAAIDGAGNALDNTLLGNGGANRLVGLGGADSLEGRGGNDTLEGGVGADTLRGGDGADRLQGGGGNDQYEIDALDTIQDASGIDVAVVGFDYALTAGIENLTQAGGAGLVGTGNGGANRLTGNGGANLLSGLFGADTLLGNAGADTLVGGAGADRLEGGGGSDVMRYATLGEGGDTVVGFNGSGDLFEVSAAGFGGGLTAGIDIVAAARFTVNTTGLSNSAPGVGQFVYESDANVLWWDADGFGGAAAGVLATFETVTNFTGADIVVVA